MKIVGLTGSIGMGKSTAAAMLRRMRVPVFDADAEVHRLLARDGQAVAPILAAFPGVGSTATGIDRQALGRVVFGDPASLKRLEAIIHPRVGAARRRFLAAARRGRAALAVLDVPLLFETAGERDCDAVIVVSAPLFLQRQRVLARHGMTEAKFEAILLQQLPDREKRQRTPYIVETGLGKYHSLKMLRHFVRMIVVQGKVARNHGRSRNRSRH